MRVIAEFEGAKGQTVAIGDTDYDGRNEVIILAVSLPCNFTIYEDQGGGAYSLEYTGPCLHPYATGDLDQDGKSELIGQNSGFVQVYESVDASSYPTQLVWSSDYYSNVVGEPAIGDTDGDGRMEILHSVNFLGGRTSFFLIFENRGDNAFALVLSDTLTNQATNGRKAIGDFDRDGRVEIAFSGDVGQLYVYESTANDIWRRTWNGATGLFAAYATSVGKDTDGNGRDELFVMGGTPWITKVYEATGDDFFAEVGNISVSDGAIGIPHNATANLDASGRQEYVMDTKVGLWIYRGTMPGQWDLVGQVVDPGASQAHAGVYAYDLNGNGRPEVVWRGAPTTLILEYRSGVADAEENFDSNPPRILVSPNPSRVQAGLRFSTPVEAATGLAVYDVAGRLVERRQLIRDASGQILWPTSHLAAGVYVLRLEASNGRAFAVGRGTVVH